jgi:LacI family repressor for deo operon, udp, cdd, tsx, nupC, and nupG
VTDSIEGVAKRAGVSIDAASRTLAGLPGVAPEMGDRIMRAARESEFTSPWVAPPSTNGHKPTVGLVVPFIDRWFFGEVISAVEAVLRIASVDVMLYNLRDETGRARFFDEMPLRNRVDAVLAISLVLDDCELATLTRLNCPLGVVGIRLPGTLSTRIDDIGGARKATGHLIERGHSRIALIGDDPNGPMGFQPPRDRRLGYHQALAAAGIPVDPTLDVHGYFTPAGGAQAARQLLAHADPPTAIFCASDEMAWGALKHIRAAGRRVPRDLALIGFDDHPAAELIDLSTMRQPVAGQAVDITTRVLASLRSGTLPADGRDVVLETELVARGSTGPTEAVA